MMDDSLKRAMKLSHEQKILLRLVHGDLVAKEDLLDLLYGEDPEGGPVNAEQCLGFCLWTLRKRLRRDGWDIETVRCYGLGVGKGRFFDGCPRTDYGKSSSKRSAKTGESPSRGPNFCEGSRPAHRAVLPSPSRDFELTDFLSNPSQRIAS
jgi:hypothetical protein